MLNPIGCPTHDDGNLFPLVCFVYLKHRVMGQTRELKPAARHLGKFTDQTHCILHPLPDDVLFTWMLEAHEEVLDATLLVYRHLVGEDVDASIDLHRVCVDDARAPVPTAPETGMPLRVGEGGGELNGELRLADACCAAYCDERAKRHGSGVDRDVPRWARLFRLSCRENAGGAWQCRSRCRRVSPPPNCPACNVSIRAVKDKTKDGLSLKRINFTARFFTYPSNEFSLNSTYKVLNNYYRV